LSVKEYVSHPFLELVAISTDLRTFFSDTGSHSGMLHPHISGVGTRIRIKFQPGERFLSKFSGTRSGTIIEMRWDSIFDGSCLAAYRLLEKIKVIKCRRI
jgi:hypothetical protein